MVGHRLDYSRCFGVGFETLKGNHVDKIWVDFGVYVAFMVQAQDCTTDDSVHSVIEVTKNKSSG